MKRRGLCGLLAVLLALTGTGCGTGAPRPVAEPAALKAPAYGDYKAQAAIREEHPVDQPFLDAVTGFSCRSAAALFEEKGGENLNYSPASLYMALSLLSAGARGETEAQLLSALGLEGKDAAYLSAQAGHLIHRLYTDNKVGVCQTANAVWIDRKAAFSQEFARRASEEYYATLFEADFSDPSTGKAIQNWIKKQTKGHLSPEIGLDPEQTMALINTLYFKDAWSQEFSKEDTRQGTFHLSGGGTAECSFMNRTFFSHGAARGDGFTASLLYLKNGGQMVLVLPDQGVDVQTLAADEERLREMFFWENTGSAKVVFSIPKFDFSCDFDLTGVLGRLGLSSVMGADADFSGLLSKGEAWPQAVRQQARIAVDEKGVESSAATEILCGSAAPLANETVELILDRPFLFGIVDGTGVPLFMGICQDPTQR